MLFSRRLRCLLDLLHHNLKAKVRQNQYRQEDLHNFHARERVLVKGDYVLVKNFSSGDPWLPTVIYFKTGPASFTVDLRDGRKVRRHLDQVRKNTSTNIIDEPSTVETNDNFPILVPNSPTAEPPPSEIPPRASKHCELRRSDRTRHPSKHFAFDIN